MITTAAKLAGELGVDPGDVIVPLEDLRKSGEPQIRP